MTNRLLRNLKITVAALAAVPLTALAALTCSFVPTTLNGTPTPVASGDGQLSLGNNSTLSTTTVACTTPNATTCTDASGDGTTLQTGLGVQPPAQPLQPFQPTTFPPVGGSNVTLNNSSLNPGAWGKVSIPNSNSSGTFNTGTYYIAEVEAGNQVTLNFAAGDYFIDKFSAGNDLVLKVTTGPVRLFVKSSFSAGNKSTFNATGTPSNLQIYLYDGASAQFGNSDNGNTSVSFNGLIYAPGINTDIQFGNNNVVKGAVLSGGDVDFGNNTKVVFDSATRSDIASINTCSLSLDLRMDEANWSDGATIADSSGSGLGGSLTGNAGGVAAKVCNGGNLGATTGNVVTTPNSSRLDLSGGGTISFWIKPSENSSRWLFGKSSDYYAYLDAAGKLVFGWGTSAGAPVIKLQSLSTIPKDQWTHVAIRLDDVAGKLFLHLNGNLGADATASTPISITNTATRLTVGNGFSAAAQAFKGVIDEFKIFKALAVSAADIASIHANESAGRNFGDGTERICILSGPQHVELVHNGSAINCLPKAISVLACTSSTSCDGDTANQYTGSFTIGSLTTPPGAQWCLDSSCATTATFPLTLDNNSTQLFLREPTARQDRLAGTAAPATNTTIQCRNTGSGAFNSTTACDLSYAPAGFVVSLPNHVSCTSATLTIQAVKSGAPGETCSPAFSGARSASLRFAYANPASGTRAPSVGGTTISTAGTSVALSFDGNGVATPAFVYDDVGKLSLTLDYTGSAATRDEGLTMTGSTSTGGIVAPAGFKLVPELISGTRYVAGKPFKLTVTAQNACATPTAVGNFGKEATPEGAAIDFVRFRPTGTGAVDGSFSGGLGSFANGSASGSNFQWSEVGSIDLNATLSSGSYLASGLGASGSTGTSGAAGPFVPDHFDTAVTHGCSSGSFTYSGQSFRVDVTARNAAGATTLNYDGSSATTPNFARDLTLSDANAVAGGTLAPTTAAASSFTAGAAGLTDPAFSFTRTTPDKAPASIRLRVVDSDTVSSASGSEGSTEIRIGRLLVANGFGSDKAALLLPVQAQYWSGRSWILNAADSCTTVPATSVALSNYRDYRGATPTTWTTSASGPGTLVGGRGTITLAAPAPAGAGSVDVAVNLGISTQDNSCLATHPAMTAPVTSLAYLRGRNGACAASGSYSADPSASATFGIYSGESRRGINSREVF